MPPGESRILPYGATHTNPRWTGDDYVPATWISSQLHDDPLYEYGLVSGLKSYVKEGDKVIVVGGGLGITAALAGQLVGPSGAVLCYEGSPWNMTHSRETARRNGLADRVSVKHAIVGSNVGVYGSTGGCETVRPEDLPVCDVLELDCEGEEQQILREMRIRPRIILVETHGKLGSTSADCASLLQRMGYRVTNLGVAEPVWHHGCLEDDILVLAGQKGSDAVA